MDDDTSTFIPHPKTKFTKFWLASAGGIGCFGQDSFSQMLGEISKCTGTEIVVIDEFKGVQVSGGSENDVDEALAKLCQIEKPLVSEFDLFKLSLLTLSQTRLRTPEIHNLAIGQTDHRTGYRIQRYEHLNSQALRRVLADPSSGSNPGLGQMFVTSLYSLNEESQKYYLSKNLAEPPLCNRENGASRIWNDFTFQEVGKGDEFASLESVLETSHSDAQLTPSEIAEKHRYLSPDKAKQVNDWVVEKSTEEVPGPIHHSEALVSRQPQTPPPMPPKIDDKKIPGIKKRRPVVQASQPETAQDSKKAPEAAPAEQPAESSHSGRTPRKLWKMTYDQDTSSSSEGQALASKAQKPSGDSSSELDEQAIASFQKLKGASKTPIKFDPSNYGLNRTSPLKSQTSIGSPKPKKPGQNFSLANKKLASRQPVRPSSNPNQLVDVLSPVDTIASNQPRLRFDTPALIPSANVQTTELAGLEIAGNDKSDKLTTASKETSSDPAARLQNLKLEYENIQDSTFLKPTGSHFKRHENFNRYKLLEEQAMNEMERTHQSEAEESGNETKTRQYHRTMSQKSAKPDQKAKGKAVALAKRQATLEDAWGKPNKPLKNRSNQDASPNPPSTETSQNSKSQKQKAVVDEDIERFLAAIEPIFNAAESFPGVLSFEIQFGLVFIPLLPKTCNADLMSSNEWSKLFQPHTGIAAPSTKFVNRLTTCGSEIDHVLDMKTSKAQGKSPMFEETFSQYNISYDFHCRTRTNELFIIAIDEKGEHTIQHPKSALGAVNMHFPGRIWDARAVVGSAFQYQPGSFTELEKAAQYIADHLWIPAEKNIRIHTSLPKGSKITIDKVFMKRWTHHRCLRPGESTAPESPTNEAQNVLLQVTEFQDLFIGLGARESSEQQHVRARFTTPEEMIQRGKVWYELSLVSPAIETILKTNTTLEVGEKTEDWCSADLCRLTTAAPVEQAPGSPRAPISAPTGAGSFTEMMKVAKALVAKMDGVGACNRGPLGFDMAHAAANMAQVSRGWDHEDIESVKEVESVVARVEVPFDAEAFKREQKELEFW